MTYHIKPEPTPPVGEELSHTVLFRAIEEMRKDKTRTNVSKRPTNAYSWDGSYQSVLTEAVIKHLNEFKYGYGTNATIDILRAIADYLETNIVER